MFRVRGTTPKARLESMFGTTAPQEDLPDIPFDFTFIEDPRLIFRRFRIKHVLKKSLNVTDSITCETEDVDPGKGSRTVMLKTFFLGGGTDFDMTKRLMYETQVYRYVRQELVPFMPTVVPWYVTYIYNPENLNVGSWDPALLREFRKELHTSGHIEGFAEFYTALTSRDGIQKIFTQITKRVDSDLSFLQFITFNPNVIEWLRHILFQIVFTLACMAELRIQHNDLHINNVLVAFDLPAKKKGYLFKGMLFWVQQVMQVRVFDWDAAYVEHLGPNEGLERFPETGIGNYFNPRYDIYTILSSVENLYTVLKIDMPADLKTFIKTVRPTLYQKSQNRLCYVEDGKCIPFPPGEPKDIMTPDLALQLPFFAKFREANPTVIDAGPGFIRFEEKSFLQRLFSSKK